MIHGVGKYAPGSAARTAVLIPRSCGRCRGGLARWQAVTGQHGEVEADCSAGLAWPFLCQGMPASTSATRSMASGFSAPPPGRPALGARAGLILCSGWPDGRKPLAWRQWRQRHEKPPTFSKHLPFQPRYEGFWKDGKQHGYGRYTTTDASTSGPLCLSLRRLDVPHIRRMVSPSWRAGRMDGVLRLAGMVSSKCAT